MTLLQTIFVSQLREGDLIFYLGDEAEIKPVPWLLVLELVRPTDSPELTFIEKYSLMKVPENNQDATSSLVRLGGVPNPLWSFHPKWNYNYRNPFCSSTNPGGLPHRRWTSRAGTHGDVSELIQAYSMNTTSDPSRGHRIHFKSPSTTTISVLR